MLGNINARNKPMTIGQLAASTQGGFLNPFGGSMDMRLPPAQGIAGLYVSLSSTLGDLSKGWDALLQGPSLLEEMGGLQGLLGAGDPTAGVPGMNYGIPGLTPGMPGMGPPFGHPGRGKGNGRGKGHHGLQIPPLFNAGGMPNSLPIAGTRVSNPATSATNLAPPRRASRRGLAARFGAARNLR